MSTYMTNSTASTSSACASDESPVLCSVPMSTTRVLLIKKDGMNPSLQVWLDKIQSAPNSSLVEPSLKMKRSYARMGSAYNSRIDSEPLELGTGEQGADILGSLFRRHLLSPNFWTPDPLSPNAESDASPYFSPPMPEETPQTPKANPDISDDEGSVEDIARRLDYHGPHEEDAIEALKLEKLLQAQRRESSANARGEAPSMGERSLGMIHGERLNESAQHSGWWMSRFPAASSSESSEVVTPTYDRTCFNHFTRVDMCALNVLVRSSARDRQNTSAAA
ncbi:hypothetical protein FRC09_010849 [Ceratobasidium sp. 395]|nr:hypothetical protein FRC09_010849 [Ceratobasidium sp. 395]